MTKEYAVKFANNFIIENRDILTDIIKLDKVEYLVYKAYIKGFEQSIKEFKEK